MSGILISHIGFLGSPKYLASFRVSLIHLGFLFPEDSSHTGVSSSEYCDSREELPLARDPETCEPTAGEPKIGEPCETEAGTSEPVI